MSKLKDRFSKAMLKLGLRKMTLKEYVNSDPDFVNGYKKYLKDSEKIKEKFLKEQRAKEEKLKKAHEQEVINKKMNSDRENTSKSDGINLDLGSNEYRELLMDRSGIDEKDQDRARDYRVYDYKGHNQVEISKDYKKIDPGIVERHVPPSRDSYYAIKKNYDSNVNKKYAQREGILEAGQAKVLSTEIKDDDERYKKMADEMVGRIHEESEPVADFYPGDGLLNKYL